MEENGLTDTAGGTFTLGNSLALFNVFKVHIPYDNIGIVLFFRMNILTEMCI